MLTQKTRYSILAIVRLFEGSIALLKCTSEKYHEPCDHCKDEQTCSFRETFKDIRDYTFKKTGRNHTFHAGDAVGLLMTFWLDLIGSLNLIFLKTFFS